MTSSNPAFKGLNTLLVSNSRGSLRVELDLHFNCFIPVNNITTKCKCIYVNNVYVSLLGAHVQPFAAHGQVYASHAAR